MLSTKKIIYLTFAVTLIGLIGIYRQLSNTSLNQQVSENVKSQVSVLTINSDINAGQSIASNHLTWSLISVAAANNMVGIIQRENFDINKLNESIARVSLKKGEFLRSDNFVLPNQSDYLTRVLQKNKRAIAIKVDAKAAIAGLVNPGDFVDVMFFHQLEKRDDQDNWVVASSGSARQIVTNVRLLAVDRDIKPKRTIDNELPESKNEKFNEQSTVTLEVSVLEAEKLALAQELGQLSLLLRSAHAITNSDELLSDKTVATFSDVLTQYNKQTDRANMVLLKGKHQVVSHYKFKE
ncbi:Flp pilus assembly protein CpaB [Pseudoalteromonas sp. NBT06-2]|uniref:Flp pilus assembly protein CpaB n=1 Tax=Pseudoalteromonas sp. NBT06-2 TaxID=2025950 RepID=UPI000BA79029|nr:Flp pilus assembly protein CpaB [Pseudoalteromonas sp. NBT06-2]PAJ72548.1 Flp pilus assembly protein CpaB [Pseudoalteromonas sp. NBT06-2]